ncbi:GerMN domain-containing protein [Virgibacillus byunsanensis]|uniref:GerMN domain-containing protein n=1 Tax=Virgibacillus byunsanensis TaxID=570945 RepID=A0ABW3LMD9_9BACI
MQKRGIVYLSLLMSLSVILAGCFQGEQSVEELDPPQDAEAVNNQEDATNESDTEADEENMESETVARQLFLVDANGMVAPQTLELPSMDSKEVAEQALQYLVKDGPVTQLLPNGFQAILPAGTEVLGLSLQEDGVVIVDVSSEFENYEAKDELKVLQSMTYTLTQFDSVDRVQLRINGQPQEEMPVNGTPIADGYSRANGINLVETDTVDLLDSKAVTLYYPTEYNENQYFVPVTQYLEVDNNDLYSSIVQALLKGPGYQVNATHVFNTEVSLANDPTLNGGVMELVFSQEILQDMEKGTISDEVMETLVLTLTEQQAVEAVQVKVEDVEQLFNENGEVYNEPVTKNSFTPMDKL